MKPVRNVLCILLLLCLAAATLTGCLSVSSEEPEETEETTSASDPPVQTHAGLFPEEPTGWSDAREALVLSLAEQTETDDYTVYGEVGAYTLCYLVSGGDTAVVEDVFAGYRIVSPTIGYPSATHLYLVGDDAIYTLCAAYTQGLIGDMGELYALLPKGMQGGYDPKEEDSFYGETDRFGFVNGVYRPE